MIDLIPDFSDPQDAQGHRKHALVGLLMGFLGSVALMPLLGPLGAMGATLMLANMVFVGKELYDMRKPNATGFSWSDIVAGNVGLMPAVGLVAVAVGV